MLRLLRTHRTLSDTDWLAFQQAQAVINAYLLSDTRLFFALPTKVSDTQLDWLSQRTGAAQAVTRLPAEQQKHIVSLAEEQLKQIAILRHSLEQQGDPQAAFLRAIPSQVELNDLYIIDNHPVLINWISATPAAPAAASIPPAAVATAPIVTTVSTTSKRSWWWLLLLLLALLIGALVAWWLWKQKNTPIKEPLTASPTISSYACAADHTPPPDFSLILDTSGSMALNLATTPAEEDWYFSTPFFLTPADKTLAQALTQSPTRLETAQTTINSTLNDLHPDIPVRLISLNSCESITDHGVFPSAQRPLLQQIINDLEPQTGTPSARALAHAAQHMDGVNKDGIILLVIDGADGCEQNICHVAESIAQQQPRLQINVVDMSGLGLSNCVAEKTNGRVYQATEVENIQKSLRQSTQELAAQQDC